MATKIHGSEKALAKLFSNDFAFTIPLYQRPYRWTTEHAEELLNDLLTAMEDGAGRIEDLDPYFLGSIVLVKEEKAAESQVLDGQQRLTTLTLLITCLRETIAREYVSNLTRYLCEEGDPFMGTRDRFRLTLRNDDQTFMEQYVLRSGALEQLASAPTRSETQRNLQANALHLYRRLADLPEETRQQLAKFMVQKCEVVVVSTPNFRSAYRVFSVLNDRGMELSYVDILKANVIDRIQDEAAKKRYAKRWEDMENELGSDRFQQLFSHIYMIHQKARPRQGLLDEFQAKVRPAEYPEEFIDEILVPLGSALQEIEIGALELPEGHDETAGKLGSLLVALKRIDHGEWLAPALLAVKQHRGTSGQLLTIITELERLAAALMILRYTRERRISRYGAVLKALEAQIDPYGDDNPLQLTETERAEVLVRLDGGIYFTGTLANVTRMILLRLDQLLAGEGASYDRKTISIEHVLPQSPDPTSAWAAAFSAEQRAQWVHRLGNLVLLSRRKNSQASNYEFRKKKNKYFNIKGGVAPFVLTAQVLHEDVWTPEVVERRQRLLLDELKKAWRLE